jgi:hypothetical protein
MSPEAAQPRLAAVYIERAARRTGLRPYLSLRGPQKSVPAPKKTKNKIRVRFARSAETPK